MNTLNISEALSQMSDQIRLRERAANDALGSAQERVADIFHKRRERLDVALANLANAQQGVTEAARKLADAMALVRSIETEAEAEATAIGSDLLSLRSQFAPRVTITEMVAEDTASAVQVQNARLTRKLRAVGTDSE